MSRMVVVTLPEDQVTQLEFLAKEESNRIGKEVTMTDLAERAVRQQIKRIEKGRILVEKVCEKERRGAY